jgi:hypothetical protein
MVFINRSNLSRLGGVVFEKIIGLYFGAHIFGTETLMLWMDELLNTEYK